MIGVFGIEPMFSEIFSRRLCVSTHITHHDILESWCHLFKWYSPDRNQLWVTPVKNGILINSHFFKTGFGMTHNSQNVDFVSNWNFDFMRHRITTSTTTTTTTHLLDRSVQPNVVAKVSQTNTFHFLIFYLR